MISDTGAVVVYETSAAPGNASSSVDDRQVWIRDRDGRTSRAVAEPGSTAPGISGNGCVVAYSVIGANDIELTVVNRCATEASSPLPDGIEIDTFKPERPGSAVDLGVIRVGAPALSFDGSTIVWSTGRDIRRYARPAAGEPHALTHTFDAGAAGSPAVVTGHQVDISADGSTAVFVAGPGNASFEPVPANVYVWAPAAPEPEPVTELTFATSSGDPGAFSSTSPTISSDGRFVAFEAMSTDPAAVGSTTVVTPFVVRADLTDGTPPIRVDDATRPTVSADGKHVVYQRGDAIRVRSFGATTTEDVGIVELADAQPTGPAAISQFGRWLVFASAADLSPDLVDPARPVGAPVVWAADRSASDGGTVDTTTSTTLSTTPQPPASPPVTVPTSTSPEVANSATIPATTLSPTVIVARFPTVASSFPFVPFPPAPRRTESSSSTFRPGAGSDLGGASASASAVAFGPTVVDAGRRTQPVTLTNQAAGAVVQISSASIDVPEGFTIVSDGCTGVSIAPGSSCVVEVQFAPITVGPANGSVVFRLSDGSVVTASLVGDGVSGPTLALVPAVAGAGQTVTVFGAGFPPGSTIELSQPGTAVAAPIVVDGDGTFAHVVVVLTNTPSGPAVLAVAGQADAFDDVAAELLISSRGAASGDTAVRSGPSSPLGR